MEKRTMSDTETDLDLPPSLRLLRTLVTLLMAVMIVAVITVVWLLVTRWPEPGVTTPEALALPAGAVPYAVTQGPNFWVVVTQDNRILTFDKDGTFAREIIGPDGS